MVEKLVPLERDIFLFFNGHHTPFFDGFFYTISQPHVWILFGLWFIFLLSFKQRTSEVVLLLLFMGFLILLTDQISSGIFKPFFRRLRPTHHPATEESVLTVLNYEGGLYGFISSHAANFMGIAIFLGLVFRDKLFALLISILMLTVSYSRIYLGVHFISDVAGGILLAFVVAPLVYKLYRHARTAFLGIPHAQTIQPYLIPLGYKRKLASISIVTFYLLVMLLSPAVILLYENNILAYRF